MASLAWMRTNHSWMGDGFKPYLGLLLWATLAAAGFLVVDQVFNVWTQGAPPAWWLAIAAGVFALIDWAESCQNFKIARGESPPRRAFLDSIYWTRALGVVLFVFGAIGRDVSGNHRCGRACRSRTLWQIRPAVHVYFVISFGAGLGVGLGVVLNHWSTRSPSPPARVVIQSAVIGPVISSP